MTTRKSSTVILNRRAFMRNSAVGALGLSLPWQAFSQSKTPVVETAAGKLQGVQTAGVHNFKGVPYGEPPVGARRFKQAIPASAWSGVKQAAELGHCAPQGTSMAPEQTAATGFSLQGPNATFSEDCLYLNVWSPGLDNRKRPVMVWLHGGGFSTGSGGSILYDGTNLASGQDVVVVTINHRLNAFGYLDLSEHSDDYVNSSLAGMQDIVLALNWVGENIANFGGDPDNVTIFGESGGGRKVSCLLAMPEAVGLFHRAIIQSGSQLRVDPPEVGRHRANLLLQSLDIAPKQLHKLQEVSPETILKAMQKPMDAMGQFRPTAGAPSLPRHPFHPDAPAFSSNVPVMAGSNLTEVSFFMSRAPGVMSLDDAGVIERVKSLVPASEAARVYNQYKNVYPQLPPSDILFRIGTDRGYFLDTTILGARKAEQAGAPAFVYSFEWQQALADGRTHVPHGSEIAFVFHNLKLARGDNPKPLADKMAEAWATFARTGNPSTEALGQWTPYDKDTRPTMILGAECVMENDPRGELRELMLSFGSQQYQDPDLISL